VIPGNQVETAPVEICCLEEVIEEFCGQRVLLSLAGIGDIARREDHVRRSNSHFGGALPGLGFRRRVREAAQHENEQRVPTVEA
jgi:hypothetical protein